MLSPSPGSGGRGCSGPAGRTPARSPRPCEREAAAAIVMATPGESRAASTRGEPLNVLITPPRPCRGTRRAPLIYSRGRS